MNNIAKLKRIIKKILSCIINPVKYPLIWFRGNRDFVIGSQLQINTTKYLKLGRNVSVGKSGRFLFITEYGNKTYEPSVLIGSNVSIGNRFSALSAARIQIGDNNLIASDVLITSENHGIELEESSNYSSLPLTAKEVVIGDGCWIGEKVSIMPGVVLGKRCIVAANSVVTHSFGDGKMLAGVPARVIKHYDYSKHQWVSEKE